MVGTRSVFCLAWLVFQAAEAALSFAASYGDHMVLQQSPSRAVLWGFAPSANPVNLNLTSLRAHDSYDAEVVPFNASSFTWRVMLPPIVATDEPHTITVMQQGASPAVLSDVLFGEVWVCSGQSNMAFLVENAFGGAELVQDANNHPLLRYFTTRKLTAGSPLRELGEATDAGAWTNGIQLPWSVSSNTSISDDSEGRNDDNWLYMSAVCYLFGKKMQQDLKVPVGLINTNWGGTMIQDWAPNQAISDCNHLLEAPLVSTHLFNAMVAPLMNQTIKGAIWYQGESNGGQPVAYSCLLPALVKYWRAGWAAGRSGTDPLFPFGVVQLAGDVGTDSLALPKFRFTGQTQNTGSLPNKLIPNSFLATAYDLGDSTSPFGSVHCRYKKEVGERLSMGALKVAYGQSVHAAPVLINASVESHGQDTFADVDDPGLRLSKMNISATHNQTNWDGSTPFEVCKPTPSPGRRLRCRGSGALAKGSDLFVSNSMTIQQAKLWCLANMSCFGFTTRSTACDGAVNGSVYFKKQGAISTPDTEWYTYLIDDSEPCGPGGGFDSWSLAPITTVRGNEVVLGGLSAPPAAVRFAWRGYPCEHLGCGLYSGNGIPPPPFHVWLNATVRRL